MKTMRARPGYAFLITVLLIGALATGLVTAALLLSSSWSRDVITLRDGSKALALARSCAERGILALRQDLSYAGNEDLDVEDDECHIGSVSGAGAWNRSLCTTGTAGDSTRRLEVSLSAVLPNVLIQSWREVPAFTLCTGE